MNVRFLRPNKKTPVVLKFTTRLPLPPFPVIDDWLKRDRQKREKKKERPSIHLPTRRSEEKPEEKKRDTTIPIVDPAQE